VSPPFPRLAATAGATLHANGRTALQTIAFTLASLGLTSTLMLGLAFAMFVELLTVLLRFGFRLESQIHTKKIGKITRGYRAHHGYYGVPLLAFAAALPLGLAANVMIIAGLGLLVSDLIHHFLVLWPVTGHHEFFIRYSAVRPDQRAALAAVAVTADIPAHATSER
jgi:hypothetical protein